MVDETGSPVSRPPWWLALLVFSGLCVLFVAISRWLPGLPLWQPVVLAAGVMVLVLYGPEMLSKVLAAGSWLAGTGSRGEGGEDPRV